MTGGEGKVTASDSGEFIHSGGWLFVHDNNSCEINMLECVEKEDFLWDKLDGCVETETYCGRGARRTFGNGTAGDLVLFGRGPSKRCTARTLNELCLVTLASPGRILGM